MSEQVAEALDALRDLGTSEALWSEASSVDVAAMGREAKVNSHIHLPPNFSAFETVQQAIDLAAAEHIDVLGVSNYYDYTVYADFVQRAKEKGIFPLFGIEIICMIDELRDGGVKINDPGNPGKMYICGKGITRFAQGGGTERGMTTEARRLLQKIRVNDEKRMDEMIRKVEEQFAAAGVPTGATSTAVKQMIAERHGSPLETIYIQERHIAQAFQQMLARQVSEDELLEALERIQGTPSKAGSAGERVTIQNEMRSHLMKAGKPAFVEESFVSFEEALALIIELGGIPAYPVLADGASPISDFERTPGVLIDHLKSRGLHAAEFIPVRNGPDVLLDYVRSLREAGLVVTAGTEHNTLDLIPIEPGAKGGAVPEEAKAIFWEGACVVAAHQFLKLHGEIGYIDEEGKLNGKWRDGEQRIRELAKLGAAVIARYQKQHA